MRQSTVLSSMIKGFPTKLSVQFCLLVRRHVDISIHVDFDMACRTIQHVSVPNMKLLESTKTKLQANEVGECSIMLHGKMGWGHSFAYQHGSRDINV